MMGAVTRGCPALSPSSGRSCPIEGQPCVLITFQAAISPQSCGDAFLDATCRTVAARAGVSASQCDAWCSAAATRRRLEPDGRGFENTALANVSIQLEVGSDEARPCLAPRPSPFIPALALPSRRPRPSLPGCDPHRDQVVRGASFP